jgi:hypothetical protein
VTSREPQHVNKNRSFCLPQSGITQAIFSGLIASSIVSAASTVVAAVVFAAKSLRSFSIVIFLGSRQAHVAGHFVAEHSFGEDLLL